jgi:hypothetical protein
MVIFAVVVPVRGNKEQRGRGAEGLQERGELLTND